MADSSHDIPESSECESSQPVREQVVASSAAKLQARRRLVLRAGAAAVPVIITLHAKTAWAGVPPPGQQTTYGTSQ